MNVEGGGRDSLDAFEPGGLGAHAVSEELVERAQRVSFVFGEFAVKREGEHVAAIEDGETSLYIWRQVKRLLRKVLAQGKGGDEQSQRTRERARLYVWYVSASFERPGSSQAVSSANQFVSASPINSLLLRGSSSLTDG
jgi:hypothetical protein